MRLRTQTALALVAICAGLGLALYPHARLAGALLAAKDDPAALADIHMTAVLREDPHRIERSIVEALDANDVDLAASLAALAADRQVILPDELNTRLVQLAEQQDSAGAVAGRFASGVVTGQADDFASFSGALAGDMFAFGDIRDVVQEGRKLAAGEEPDRLILGLAAAGIAFTAVTYASAGATVPVRAGLTLVKDARKVGRLGEGLTVWAGRVSRDLVDLPALQSAIANVSMTRPAPTLAAIRGSFHTERAGRLVRTAKDVGRVGQAAGVRGAKDALRIAESPADLARAARLAEAKGGQTRAFLKMLGRGALVLLVGAMQLSSWVLGFLVAAIGLLIAIKGTSERAARAAAARWRVWRDTRAVARAKADAERKAAEEPQALMGPPAPV